MSQASPPRRSMVSTAGSSRKSVSSSGSRGTPGPPTAGAGASGASTTASSRQGRVSKTPLMDAKRRATALRRRMDPNSMGAPVDAFLNSAPSRLARRTQRSSIANMAEVTREATESGLARKKEEARAKEGQLRGLAPPPVPLQTILRLERKDRLGSWNPSQPLFFALMAQQGGAGVPRRPPPGLLEDHITCADWEWTTALVRAVLRHNVRWFDHSYRIVERGDEHFTGARGAAIERAAARRGRRGSGGRDVRATRRTRRPTTLLAEEGDLFELSYKAFLAQKTAAVREKVKRQRSMNRDFLDHAARRGGLTNETLLTSLDDELQEATNAEFEYLTRKRAETDVVEGCLFTDDGTIRKNVPRINLVLLDDGGHDPGGPVRNARPGERNLHKLWYNSWGLDVLGREREMKRLTRLREVKPEEKPPIAAKARKAAKSLLFINRTDLLAKAKLDAATVAERQREADEKAAKEARVVRALGAFDKQRREIYHCLKQAIQTCNDKSLLNMQRREAFVPLVELLGPPVPAVTLGIKRAAILGIQRAVVDAVEAIRAWQEPPPQDDDSDDDDADRGVRGRRSREVPLPAAAAERPPSAPAEGPVVDGAGTPAPSAPPSARPAPPPPPAPAPRRRPRRARAAARSRVLEGDAARSRRPSQQSSDGGESVDEGALFGAGTKANTGSVEACSARSRSGAEKAVAPPKPPKPPPPDPKPFIWNGVDFLLSVRHAMDFLAESRDFRAHLGGEFPLRENPFAQPQPIDEPVQGQVDDHATAPDSDDDDGDGAAAALAKDKEHLSTWPHQGHSDHQQRIEACRVYVLEAEVRHRRRAEEDRKALRHAMRERRREEKQLKLDAAKQERPWDFVDHNDPTGKKRKMLEKRAKTPGAPKRIPRSESLPRILRPTVTRL
ncbi:hypothetical protein JL720_6640 [Aureococcus anophagefferens]|nr:hypothetical protein JL720_6640 [Aureococcus anophagefferens]